MAGVLVDVNAKIDSASRDLEKINLAVQNISTSASKTKDMLVSMAKSIALAASGAISVGLLSKVSNEYSNMGNQIALVTGRTNDLIYAQKKLLDITVATRASMATTVSTFSTFGKTLQQSGVSIDAMLAATKVVQQSVAISGATAESANAALVQLGQGLASGTLRGQELNSVMEQTPRLAQAIADSMGVGLGALRKIAEEGGLTSQTVFRALLTQSSKINEEFSRMQPTLAQGTSLLSRSVSEFVNELDKGFGISDKIGSGLAKTANVIFKVAETTRASSAIYLTDLRDLMSNIAIVAEPIKDIFIGLGKTVIKALPKGFLTNTFIGEYKEMLRLADDFSGNFFTAITRAFQFDATDLMTWDSELETALKKLKRLSPDNWVTGGFDKQTISRFFSIDTLKLYGNAFGDVARAIEHNLTSIFPGISNVFREIAYTIKDVLRFFGVFQDTLLTFRIGDIGNLIYTFAEGIRGITGLQLGLNTLGDIIEEVLGGPMVRLKLTMRDLALGIPGLFINAFENVSDLFFRFLKNLIVIIQDFWRTGDSLSSALGADSLPSFDALGKSLHSGIVLVEDFSKEISSKLKNALKSDAIEDMFDNILTYSKPVLDSVITLVSAFAKDVMYYFFLIYDKVIGHSYWPDLMDGLLSETSKLTVVFTKIKSFASSVIGVFSDLSGRIVNIFDLASITSSIREVAYTLEKKLSSAFISVVKDVGNFISALKLAFSIAKFDYRFNFIISKSYVSSSLKVLKEEVKYAISDLFDTIANVTPEKLNKTLSFVASFAKDVKDYFFDIYDKVVGHSYWPDTIDGVIRHSDRLQLVIAKIAAFKDKVVESFKSLFEATGKNIGFKIPAFKTGDMSAILADARDTLLDAGVLLANKLGETVKIAFFGLGAIAAAIFLPSFLGKFKILLVSLLAENFLTHFALLSENLSSKIFNVSAAVSFGKALGTALGSAVSSFIKSVPEMLNALLAVVSGFTKAFLAQMPIIGDAFKGLFNITDQVGLSNAAGLIGAILFGPSVVGLFSNIKIVKTFMEVFSTAYKNLTSLIMGKSGGIIVQSLFGALGPASVISGFLLVAEAFGIFDGIFVDSPLMKYVATGGLIMTFLFGKSGVEAIKSAILKSGIGQSIGEAVFGKISSSNKGEWADSVTNTVKAAFKKVEDTIVDFAAKHIKSGMKLLSTVLFGENPEIVKNKFKNLWKDITTSYLKFLDGIEVSPLFNKFKQAFSSKPIDFNFDQFINTAKFKDGVSGIGNIAKDIGGENGILDKMFFGKNGKRNLLLGLAAVLVLFTGFASAAEFSVDKPLTAIERLKETINFAFDTNPILAWSLVASTVAIPAVLIALYKFRAEANVVLGTLWAKFAQTNALGAGIQLLATAFSGVSGAIGKVVAGKGAYVSAVLGMAAASGVAAISGANLADSLLIGISVAGLAMQAWEAFGKALLARIAATAAGAAALAGAMTFGLVGAGVLALGVIGAYLFGDSKEGGIDGIMDGFSNIKQKMADVIGLGRNMSGKQAELTDKFTPEISKAAELSGVATNTINFANIPFNDISANQQKSLEKLTDKLIKEINKGAEETLERGSPTDATSQSIRELYKNLESSIDRLEATSRINIFESVKNLNQFNQNKPSWLAYLGEQVPIEIGLAMVKHADIRTNELFRAFASTENKAKFTANIDRINLDPDNIYKYNFRRPTVADTKVQNAVNGVYDPSNISDTKLSKEFNEAVKTYATASQKYAEAIAPGRYTGLDPKVTALNKSEAGKDLIDISGRVKDFQGRQLDVVNFNKDINKAINLLKEVNVEVDNNLLFTGDWRNFGDIDDLIRKINTLGKEIKDTSGATGARSFEERTKQIKEQANNVLLLNTRIKQKSELDNAFNEPTDSISAVSLRIPDFKVSAEEIRKGFKGPVTEITKQMHELENLHLGGAVGTFGTAAMLQWLPKGIDPQVKERISHNYEAYAEFVRDKQKRLEETIRNFSTPGTQLKSLGEATGFGTSVSDLAGYSGKHIDKLIPQLNKLLTLQNEYDAKISGGDFIGASKTANSVKDLQIQMDAAKPLFKSLTDHMSELSNIGATFTISELFRVNPNDLARLRVLAREVAAIDKVAATAKTAGMSSESIYALSERRNKRLKEAEEINSRNRILSFTTELQAISTAGGKIDVNKYLKIDDATMKAYRELEQLIYRNNIILADRSGKYKPSDTKKAAVVVNQAQEATSLLNIDTESYNDKLSSLSTAFSEIGVTANDFSRLSKNARDAIAEINDQYRVKELDLAKLTFKDSNEEIEEYRRARVEMLKKMEESFADNGRPSVTFARRVTKTGNQLDLAAANLVSDMDKQLIGTMVDSLRAMERDLDINGGINTATDKVMQNEIENVRFNIGLALKRATRRRQDMLYYQAGVDFANSISSSVSDGFKSLLKGESGVRDTIEGIAANYGKKVIDTFVDGLMSTVSGPGSAFEGIFRTIGENLFNSGSDSWVGKLFSGKKQDDPSQIATLDLTAATRDLAAAFRAYLPSKAGIATNDSFKSLNQDIRYTGAQGVSNLSSNTDLYSTIVSDSNLAIPGDDYAELMKPLDDITNTKLAIDSSANKISDAITDPAIPWSLPIVAGIGLVGNLIGGSTAQIVNALLAISLILGQEQMNKLGGSIMGAGKSLLSMIPGSSLLSFLPAFADGGFVPGNVGAPVPVLAHGGELILNAKQQSSLLRKGGENTSVFNISISGDISRQTRSTILEMIPQIALGVNSQNRESGYR